MSEKPGIMVYFEMRNLLKLISDEDAGILFRAMLDFGAERIPPQLPDRLNVAWPLIKMHLESDDIRYYEVSNKRKYAVYVRWAKERGEEPLKYSEWLLDQQLQGPTTQISS